MMSKQFKMQRRQLVSEVLTGPGVPAYYAMQANGYRIAVFTSTQIANWGLPEEWGFREEYQVAERARYGLSYTEECRATALRRSVHRYSRYERFRTILQHLMGIHGHVPAHIIEACEDAEDWESIRAILKARGWTLYYSRIPIIMAAIELPGHPSYTDQASGYARTYERILAQFRDMDAAWPSVRAELGRAYFPNLRYCALRLMASNGVTHLTGVPLLRTAKKVETVGHIYEHILTFIQAQEMERWMEAEGL